MQDRIKQMAEEAGIDLDPHGGISRAYPVNLERFAQAVARECAEISKTYVWWDDPENPSPDEGNEQIAKAIRARFGIEGA